VRHRAKNARKETALVGVTEITFGVTKSNNVTRCCALYHVSIGKVPRDVADATSQAATKVINGEHDRHFQEVVLSNRGIQILEGDVGSKSSPVHPNDHVNAGQSSYESFPTAMHKEECTIPGLTALAMALRAKSEEFNLIVKIGRTHCEGAMPLTLGHEFGAYFHNKSSLAWHRTYPSVAS
jgi:fumarate hydratase class II